MTKLQSMKAQTQIEEVYNIVRCALPARIRNKLRVLPVDASKKKGNDIMRGRIIGTKRMGVWNSKWCFYEIGIGFYANAPAQKNHGGIGFVSFPENKCCGEQKKGKNRRALVALLARIDLQDGVQQGGKFKSSGPLETSQCSFTYYSGASFPLAQAAADLAVLIVTTFHDLDRLTR